MTEQNINLDDLDQTPDGAALLDEVRAWLGSYLSVPSKHHTTVITLWAAHTHAAHCFYVTARLILDSAEPESGKTRVLELLNLICRAPIFTMNTTIAALYRRLASGPRTVLLDETDAIFAPKAAQNHEDLRALLDAGYKRGATVDRCVGDASKMEVREFPAYAPVALAGIVGHMPRTITSRAVTLHMRRRAPGEDIAEYIEEDVIVEAAPLRESLSDWVASIADERLKGARPAMPNGIRDRNAEVWRAMLAVADAAGGHWPDTARAACRHLVLDTDPGELSLGMRLLSDLYDVFGDADAMSSAVIVEKLQEIEDAPWSDLYGKPITQRRLSRELGKHRVRPKVVRIGDSTPRGYTREDLVDLWLRYLPQKRNIRNKRNAAGRDVADVADVADPPGSRPSPPLDTHLGRKDGLGVGTCADCRKSMTIIYEGQTTHPGCDAESTTGQGSADDRVTRATDPDQCAAPGCDRPPRNACHTCPDHMTDETRYAA